MTTSTRVREAQHRIATILAELEIATGQHVKLISIQNTDVTSIGEAVPRWTRAVLIDLQPIPGSDWITS